MDAIVTFHSIDDSGSVLSYAPAAFDEFLDVLARHGVRVVDLDELRSAAGRGEHRVALTFDDGFRSVVQEALPRLAARGWPATLFVVAAWVGRTNDWPGQPEGMPRFDLATWDELRRWCEAGMSIGCHGWDHRALEGLDDPASREEIEEARERIASRLSRPVDRFAYPYGRFDDEAARRVESSYACSVTTRMRFLPVGTSSHRLPRIDAYYLRRPRSMGSPFTRRARVYLAGRAILRELRGLVETIRARSRGS